MKLLLEDELIGFETGVSIDEKYSLSGFLGQELSTNNQYYGTGLKYNFDRNIKMYLEYLYWLNKLPGYESKKGINIGMNYIFDDYSQISGEVFMGDMSEDGVDDTEVINFNLVYNDLLYFNKDIELHIRTNLNTGYEQNGYVNYLVSNFSFPTRVKGFNIIPGFGYIKTGNEIIPSYDMNGQLNGYKENKISGNRKFTIKLEKEVQLFPETTNLLAGSLSIPIFIQYAGILAEDEDLSDLELHNRAGLALALNMGQYMLRLEGAYIDGRDPGLSIGLTNNF